jgi:pyruvate kinase
MSSRAPRRRTKIVCTIGPATGSAEAIVRLAEAGMDVARLNFSYGDHEFYHQVIEHVRAASAQVGKPIAILQDLAGPKIRIGALPGGQVELKPGDEVVLSAAPSPSPGAIPLPAPELPRALGVGQRVLLKDGRIELRVIGTTEQEIRCQVVVGGVLRSHQGVNVPDAALPVRAVTEKDLADLEFGVEHGVDWVAMSFVRDASDMEPIRDRMGELGLMAGVMAKIEKHEAIGHLDGIIAQADAVMVARGDLGIELPLDQVPIIQKEVIRRCNQAGKPVVTATQMLESMIASPRPTRAEVSDIANAVLDGTDAVMLSGETAAGSYPQEAVAVMARVALRAEAAFDYEGRLERSSRWPCETISDAIAQATCGLAQDLGARAIITPTSTGHTPEMVAMHRPRAPIVAITENDATQRRLALVWGVYALRSPRGRNTDEVIRTALAQAQAAGFVEAGDRVIVTAGVPSGIPGRTNVIKVEVVGYHEGVEGAASG